MKRLLAALALLSVLAPAARAVKPAPRAQADAKRFGLNRLKPPVRKAPSSAARGAFRAFNAAQGGSWKVRFSERTGLPSAISGAADFARSGPPDQAARSFLTAHKDVLGVETSSLRLDRQVDGDGSRHLLYRQTYRGLPVEFAAVKVHMDRHGAVFGVNSSYEPSLDLPTTPAVDAGAAGRAAVADAGGGGVGGAPELVVAPLESDGRNHLAWKLRVDGGGGAWRYYVDALTGQVLFRYSLNQYITCSTSGTVSGMVYDVDQRTPLVSRPFNNQYVYVSAPPVQAVTAHDSTYGDGFFCGQATGKVSMSLQGPYVSVSEFRGNNAHYDNGSGTWSTYPTPTSSLHPYLNATTDVKTINIAGAGSCANAVEFMPVFSAFQVGSFGGGESEGSGDIIDNDQLFIYDGAGNPVASYIGDRGPFHGASVHGSFLSMKLESNAAGQLNGYDVAVSSCLTLTNPTQDGAPLSSHTWTTADTSVSLRSEINLFYHLNRMHDFIFGDVNKSSAAPVTKPVVAMAHVGPNLVNAFYDPDHDNLFFGDVNSSPGAALDAFTDDATVPHHEYMHYIVEKIWSIQNYGQAGTISEAQADYFSASSLNDSAIGVGALLALGSTGVAPDGALRELDSHKSGAQLFSLCDSNAPSCVTRWTGEIHDDSPFVSQALWDIRRDRIAASPVNGQSCADNLVFQSLLYFPESFSELYEAMLQVDRLGVVTACGGANAAQGIITQAFSDHLGLLIAAGGDAFEPNDGFETATDISTRPAVSATISPAADLDFYSFGAGPGLVQVTLSLPSLGGGLHKPYQLFLYDASRRQVAFAAPSLDFGADAGACLTDDCATTKASVTLRYNNPAGGLLYVQVAAADGEFGSNSGVNSTLPYALSVSYVQGGALSGSVVNAKFDKDVIAFNVQTSTFVKRQDWSFASAQLRDQAFQPLADTLTHLPRQAGDFLNFISSSNAYGEITGTVQLSTGFAARYPSAGTVYLEVFATDALGATSSMGLSNPINLSAAHTELTAYNNILTPGSGQRATVKYAVSDPGHLTIKLYTSTGRLVSTLFDGDVTAGKGSVDWDGHNTNGNVVASGVYVVRAEGPGLHTTQKIVVVK